jgi:hypothetical protein
MNLWGLPILTIIPALILMRQHWEWGLRSTCVALKSFVALSPENPYFDGDLT